MIQIQKARIYYVSENEAASRDAVIYAQRIQKKLLENNLADEAEQQAFLDNSHARQLQKSAEALSPDSA